MTANAILPATGQAISADDVGALTAATVTLTVASPCVVTDTGHKFADGQPIVLTTTGALPTGLTSGAVVFVKTPVAGTSYNLALTAGGSAINTTGTQSGVHTRTAVVYEQRVFASVESKLFNATFATLTRPANVTAYSANDSISDNATAASVTALAATAASNANNDPLCITELIVDTTDTGLAAGVQIRAYLFNSGRLTGEQRCRRRRQRGIFEQESRIYWLTSWYVSRRV